MDMWVKSQKNNLLIKANQIHANVNAIMINEITVAEYISSERALEVLNDMQRFINTDGETHSSTAYGNWIHLKVYEMPKKGAI